MAPGNHELHWDPAAERMIALARNAHRNIDHRDDIAYWYRLGQRNAYAHAAGIVIGRGFDSTEVAISERLTAALEDGVCDPSPLRSRAFGQSATDSLSQSPTWLGPAAFAAQYGSVPGIDDDYGMRWGAGGDQRISLRHPVAGDRGLLYAYDPTWDEYAVLCRDATVQAVKFAFARAAETNVHMCVTAFAAIVASHDAARTLAPEGQGLEL